MGVCISSESSANRRVFPFNASDHLYDPNNEHENLTLLTNTARHSGFDDGMRGMDLHNAGAVWKNGGGAASEDSDFSRETRMHTFVPLLYRQTNTQYLCDRCTTKVSPHLKQNSYVILFYFQNEAQISVILALLGALMIQMQEMPPGTITSNGRVNHSQREHVYDRDSPPEHFTLLAVNSHSMLLHIERSNVLFEFYRLFFKYLNASEMPTSWIHSALAVQHQSNGVHASTNHNAQKISLRNLRILNSKLLDTTEATTEFLVKQFRWQETSEDEILFDKEMDEEMRLMEQQLHVEYDLTMSDFFSISLLSYIPSPHGNSPKATLALDSSAFAEHDSFLFHDSTPQKCTVLTIELSQHLFSVNTTQILRTFKQFTGEVVSLETSPLDSDRIQLVVLWMHILQPQLNVDNMLENNTFIPENGNDLNEHKSTQMCEFAVRAASRIQQLCQQHVQEPLLRMFITTNFVQRGYLHDVSMRLRTPFTHGDAIQVSAQCLKLHHDEADTLPLFFVDSMTLAKARTAITSSPSPMECASLPWNQVQYVQPYSYQGIPFVVQEVSTSKMSLLQRCIDSMVQEKLQTILLVGQETPVNERLHLQDSIQNYCVEQKWHCTHLFRCLLTTDDGSPFRCVRKLLQELLCAHAAHVSRRVEGIEESSDLTFTQNQICLILDLRLHKYLSVLNAPFDVNFPLSDETMFLCGQPLDAIQNDLLQQVIAACVDTLPHGIVLLLDSFENFDNRSKHVVNMLYECLTGRSALVSITLSGTRHWHSSADRVIETGKIASRTQFEKHLEVTLQDQLLGIDEQFMMFLLKQTNLNVNYARELTQFLLHHQKVEVDENDILQFDPALQFSSIMMRLHSYHEFLQTKFKNMDSSVQTIVSSLSVLGEPFSFQMIVHILRGAGLFQDCSTFLWSILVKLSVHISDGTISHSTIFFLDQNNMFRWISEEHRDAAFALLDRKRATELRSHASHFLWSTFQSNNDLLQATELFLVQTSSAGDELQSSQFANMAQVSELIDNLERQHRIYEASILLRRKITFLKINRKSQQVTTREIAQGHLRLAGFLRCLQKDDGRFYAAIQELKEGLPYCASWSIMHHQCLFQLWYLYDKVNDLYASNMYASRLLEISVGESDSKSAEIAFVFSMMCKCTLLYRNEDYHTILDSVIEPCLVAYGKHADEMHVGAVKRFGGVDPILPILCYASAASWLTSRKEKAMRYFDMAQHIMTSNRILHHRFKKEFLALHWLSSCFWMGKNEEIIRISKWLCSQHVEEQDSPHKSKHVDELYTSSIPILFTQFALREQKEDFNLKKCLTHVAIVEQNIPGVPVVILIHIQMLIDAEKKEEALNLLNRIMPSPFTGIPSTPRGTAEKKSRGKKWTPLQSILCYYKSKCVSEMGEKLILLRGVLESKHPAHFHLRAATDILDAEIYDREDVDLIKKLLERVSTTILSEDSHKLVQGLRSKMELERQDAHTINK